MAQIIPTDLGQVKLPELPKEIDISQIKLTPKTAAIAIAPMVMLFKPIRSIAIGMLVTYGMYRIFKEYEEGTLFS